MKCNIFLTNRTYTKIIFQGEVTPFEASILIFCTQLVIIFFPLVFIVTRYTVFGLIITYGSESFSPYVCNYIFLLDRAGNIHQI